MNEQAWCLTRGREGRHARRRTQHEQGWCPGSRSEGIWYPETCLRPGPSALLTASSSAWQLPGLLHTVPLGPHHDQGTTAHFTGEETEAQMAECCAGQCVVCSW